MQNYEYVEITNGQDIKVHRIENEALMEYRRAHSEGREPIFKAGTFPFGYRYIKRNFFQRLPEPMRIFMIVCGIMGAGLVVVTMTGKSETKTLKNPKKDLSRRQRKDIKKLWSQYEEEEKAKSK